MNFEKEETYNQKLIRLFRESGEVNFVNWLDKYLKKQENKKKDSKTK